MHMHFLAISPFLCLQIDLFPFSLNLAAGKQNVDLLFI